MIIAAACIGANCLLSAPLVAAGTQPVEPVVVQGQSPRSRLRHLHIAYGVKDTDYRQQVLALTPLGSTYDEVKAFAVAEWRYQNSKQAASSEEFMLRLWSYVLPIEKNYSTMATVDLMREETPYIKIDDLNNPFDVHTGRRYMNPIFKHRPIFWKDEIHVSVWYVFDEQDRVIDVFADGSVVRHPNW